MNSDKPLHDRLRAICGHLTRDADRADVLTAAAEIEGHNMAFEAVVENKRAVEAELATCRANLDHRHELIDHWRELLVALQNERPDDVRIKRALMGEHPMWLAPWERL